MTRRERVATFGVVAALLSAAGFVAFRRWHLRWGATDEEVARPMPGDELLPDAEFVPTRAITIDATPEQVWPWIVQLGYGRAGWYSYDLLDNLGHGRSAERIVPEFQHPEVGDWIPMAPMVNEETAFKVRGIDPPRSMWWSKPTSTWSWRLDALPGGRTRLVTRVRVKYRWREPVILADVILMELGDFLMMRRELLGIARRAQALAAEGGVDDGHEGHRPAGTDPEGGGRVHGEAGVR